MGAKDLDQLAAGQTYEVLNVREEESSSPIIVMLYMYLYIYHIVSHEWIMHGEMVKRIYFSFNYQQIHKRQILHAVIFNYIG